MSASSSQTDGYRPCLYNVPLSAPKSDQPESAPSSWSVKWIKYRPSLSGHLARDGNGGKGFVGAAEAGSILQRQLDNEPPLKRARLELNFDRQEPTAAEPDTVELGRRAAEASIKAIRLNLNEHSKFWQHGITPRLCKVDTEIIDGVSGRVVWIFDFDEAICAKFPLKLEDSGLKDVSSGLLSCNILFPALFNPNGKQKTLSSKAYPQVSDLRASIKSGTLSEAYDAFITAVENASLDHLRQKITLTNPDQRIVRLGDTVHNVSQDAPSVAYTISVALAEKGLNVLVTHAPSSIQPFGGKHLQLDSDVVLSPMGITASYKRLFAADPVKISALRVDSAPRRRSHRSNQEFSQLKTLNSQIRDCLDNDRQFDDWAVFAYNNEHIAWPLALAFRSTPTSSTRRSHISAPNLVQTARGIGSYVDQLYRDRDKERQRREQPTPPTISPNRRSPPGQSQFLPNFVSLDAFTPKSISDAYMTPKDDSALHRVATQPENRAVPVALASNNTQAAQRSQTLEETSLVKAPEPDDWDFGNSSQNNFWDSLGQSSRADDTNIFATMGGGLTEDDFDFFDLPAPSRGSNAASPAVKIETNIFASKSETPASLSASTPRMTVAAVSPGVPSGFEDSPIAAEWNVSAAASPQKLGQTPAAASQIEEDTSQLNTPDTSSLFHSISFGPEIGALDTRYNPRRKRKRKTKAATIVPSVLRPDSPNHLKSKELSNSPQKSLPSRRWIKLELSDSEDSDEFENAKPQERSQKDTTLQQEVEPVRYPVHWLTKITTPLKVRQRILPQRQTIDQALQICAASAAGLFGRTTMPQRGIPAAKAEHCSLELEVGAERTHQSWPELPLKLIRGDAVVAGSQSCIQSWSKLMFAPLSGRKQTSCVLLTRAVGETGYRQWLDYFKEVYMSCNLGQCFANKKAVINLTGEDIVLDLVEKVTAVCDDPNSHVTLFAPTFDFSNSDLAALAKVVSAKHHWTLQLVSTDLLNAGQAVLPEFLKMQRLSHQVYDCIENGSISRSTDQPNQCIFFGRQPAFTLHKTKKTKPKFVLNCPIRSLRPLDRHRFLHFAYVRLVTNAYIISTDDLGEGHAIATIAIAPADLQANIRQIWNAMRYQAAQASVEWRAVISFLGEPDVAELDAWSSVLTSDLARCDLAIHVSLVVLNCTFAVASSESANHNQYQSFASTHHFYSRIPLNTRLVSNSSQSLFNLAIIGMHQSPSSSLDMSVDDYLDDTASSLSNLIHLGKCKDWPTSFCLDGGPSTDLPWHMAFLSIFS